MKPAILASILFGVLSLMSILSGNYGAAASFAICAAAVWMLV